MVAGRNQFSSDVVVEALLSDKHLLFSLNCVLIGRIRLLIINLSRNPPQICLQSSILVLLSSTLILFDF